MKHIKLYEDIYDEPKMYNVNIGDYVIVTRGYKNGQSSYPIKIKNGDRCKVISNDTRMGSYYVVLQNENGDKEEYRKDRFIPEIEYAANKFNL